MQHKPEHPEACKQRHREATQQNIALTLRLEGGCKRSKLWVAPLEVHQTNECMYCVATRSQSRPTWQSMHWQCPTYRSTTLPFNVHRCSMRNANYATPSCAHEGTWGHVYTWGQHPTKLLRIGNQMPTALQVTSNHRVICAIWYVMWYVIVIMFKYIVCIVIICDNYCNICFAQSYNNCGAHIYMLKFSIAMQKGNILSVMIASWSDIENIDIKHSSPLTSSLPVTEFLQNTGTTPVVTGECPEGGDV